MVSYQHDTGSVSGDQPAKISRIVPRGTFPNPGGCHGTQKSDSRHHVARHTTEIDGATEQSRRRARLKSLNSIPASKNFPKASCGIITHAPPSFLFLPMCMSPRRKFGRDDYRFPEKISKLVLHPTTASVKSDRSRWPEKRPNSPMFENASCAMRRPSYRIGRERLYSWTLEALSSRN